MNRGAIRGAGHDPAHRVDFTHEMPLADAADRWIARHLAEIVGAERQQRDARTAAGSRTSRLAPSMTPTNDNYVEHRPPIQATAFSFNAARQCLPHVRSPISKTCRAWMFHVKLFAEAEAAK